MLDYAAAHYQEKVALQDIANALNYSIAFLNKRFKKQTGTTFIEYLNRYRIQKALDLMKNGKLPLHEISWQCGIGDYKYFNTVFRKYLGLWAERIYGADRRLAEVSSKRGTFHRVSRFLCRLCCQSGEKPGQPKLSGQSRENAYLRAMLWRADTSYIRLRMAETSLRLMVLSAWNVPFASEPVRMPAR